MKRGELRKLSDSARRKVSRNFGFRQSGYINWIVKDGYFFCLQHLGFANVFLDVKPMYADDLWWDIFNLSENKKCPISLRGTGAFISMLQNLKDMLSWMNVQKKLMRKSCLRNGKISFA